MYQIPRYMLEIPAMEEYKMFSCVRMDGSSETMEFFTQNICAMK